MYGPDIEAAYTVVTIVSLVIVFGIVAVIYDYFWGL